MSIVVDHLDHIYHENSALQKKALEGICLSIERDQWVSIVGHTGSGKSTLAQHLNAILRPSRGTVTVDGIQIVAGRGSKGTNYREIRRKVGLVFQYPEQQLFEENVENEIAFAPKNWGVDQGKLPSLVKQSLVAVGLDQSFLKRSPFSLSGGEKRRVAIASVLAASPDYLVLDEPTAGLDGRGRNELMSLLDGIHAAGTGIILITHDLEIAFERSNRILVLQDGNQIRWGNSADVASFLSSHPIRGLVLPDVLKIALALREHGRRVPLTCSPETLLQALKAENQK